MDYLNFLLQKWMPSQQRVAVDSTPTLHGIWDTINTTLATAGAPTRLPAEFYDSKAYSILDRLVTEEEYAGYKESVEYRTLGIGAMLGETVQRMIRSSSLEKGKKTKNSLSSSSSGETLNDKGENRDGSRSSRSKAPKFALFGCHDSTIAGALASLGALEGENNKWPSFTSSLAIELFYQSVKSGSEQASEPSSRHHQQDMKTVNPLEVVLPAQDKEADPDSDVRKYVRIRYNDRPVVIPGCRKQGNHLAGDESMCTFVS